MSNAFTRAPEHNRRIARGDDFAGDAWRGPEGDLFYVAVGHTPVDERTESERSGSAITMRDQVLGLLAELKTMPTGDQICDLLAEDQIANFVWWRCVDWVLYRLAHGLPVQRMNTDDDVPAAINAQFEEAKTRMYRARTTGARTSDVLARWDLSNATTIERWERTPPPAPAAAVRVTYDHTNPNDDGDLNSDGIGDLAYTNFVCGDGDAKAEISFSHLPLDDAGRAVVYLFGRDDVDLDQVERTLESLLVLLADPRVQAMRAAANVGGSTSPRCPACATMPASHKYCDCCGAPLG